MKTNRTEIEARLRRMVGSHLWDATRSLNLLMLQFGGPLKRHRRNGEEVLLGAHTLHIQCAWRVIANEELIVGSRDRLTPRGNPDDIPEDFDCNEPRVTLLDEKFDRLIAKHETEPLVVTDVSVGDCGAFRLALTKAHSLEVFPDETTDEQWRYIKDVGSDDSEQAVA